MAAIALFQPPGDAHPDGANAGAASAGAASAGAADIGWAPPAAGAGASDTVATAIFAGGCFWCMEPPFDEPEGVLSTTSGYTGGRVADPTYEQVSSGGTGHYEAVRIRYDPRKVGYGRLLEVFWRNVDPLDAGGQFCDRGDQYRSAIFYLDGTQERQARASKRRVQRRFEEPVATEVLPAEPFYEAEDYHQDYYRTHKIRYKLYRFSCGRDRRLEQVWDH